LARVNLFLVRFNAKTTEFCAFRQKRTITANTTAAVEPSLRHKQLQQVPVNSMSLDDPIEILDDLICWELWICCEGRRLIGSSCADSRSRLGRLTKGEETQVGRGSAGDLNVAKDDRVLSD
jgi:hypothetical protein